MSETVIFPFFVVYVTTTFSPGFKLSASIPSGRLSLVPFAKVIESCFVSTLSIVPVLDLASAPDEHARSTRAARVIGFVMVPSLWGEFSPHAWAELTLNPRHGRILTA